MTTTETTAAAKPEEFIDRLRDFGITPSSEVIRLQEEANRARDERRRTSSLATLTYDTAMADAREALVGLAADLTGTTERTSLKAMLTHGNRMRGLGVLLITLATAGLFIDYVMTD